jgi:hypothetical protein
MEATAEEKTSVNVGEIVDIRGMQSPENVLCVLKRVSAFPNGTLEIRADCNPWQLYDLLQQRGFFLLMEKQKDGTYLGKITPRDLPQAQH